MRKNPPRHWFLTAVVLAGVASLAVSSTEAPAVKIDVAVDSQPVEAGSTAKVEPSAAAVRRAGSE